MKKIALTVLISGALLAACKRDTDLAPYNDNITYAVSDTLHLLADDSSRINVTIKTKDAVDGSYFTITVPATAGTLIGADASNKIYVHGDVAKFALVTSNVPGNYRFSTQYADKAASYLQFPIHLQPALPDVITAEPGQSFLDSSSTTKTFLITLKRKQGLVSQGVGVKAFAYQLNNKGDTVRVGRFAGLTNDQINAAGQISLNFFSDTGGFAATAPVYFKFYCSNNTGQEVKAIAVLRFK